MKYLKYILFGFLFLFIFNIDALAYGVECHYEIKWPSGEVYTEAIIKYDGENAPTIEYPNYVYDLNVEFRKPNSIAVNNLMENGQLTCPNMYQGFHADNSFIGMGDINRFIFSPVQSEVALTGYTTAILEPTVANIDNSGSTSQNYEEISCKYETSNNLAFSFSIRKDIATGTLSFFNPVYYQNNNAELLNGNFDFKRFNDFTCPEYINFDYGGLLTSNEITPSTTATAWVYVGAEQTASQNAGLGIYLAYNFSAKVRKVVLEENAGKYTISVNNQNVEINNLHDNNNVWFNAIENNNSDAYPTYLVQDGNGWHFTDTKPGSSYLNLYIYYEHLFEAKIDDDLTNTCQIIIGNDFLEFLNNNVLKIIYIGVPIILILLTSFDFAKVVFIDDKEGIQKAGKRFGKRVIVAVLIYLIPTILIFISNLIGADNIDECVKQLNQIVDEES